MREIGVDDKISIVSDEIDTQRLVVPRKKALKYSIPTPDE
jgi:hypothetical protein